VIFSLSPSFFTAVLIRVDSNMQGRISAFQIKILPLSSGLLAMM
jgi:hypothetical protein